jgi:hypothetical protein
MNRTLAHYISVGIGLGAIGMALPAQAAIGFPKLGKGFLGKFLL